MEYSAQRWARLLEKTLLNDIPITRAMGICVEQYDGRSLRLHAPLAKNDNHQATAFGGSLYSLAVLAGWGLLFVRLGESGRHGTIVIQDSRIRYLRPVTEDIRATCRMVSGRRFEALLRTYDRRGRARIDLSCSVEARGEPAVEFEGRYVIYR